MNAFSTQASGSRVGVPADAYTDFSGLTRLRAQARQQDQGAQAKADTLRQVASQFESIFMNMMLKSMREASIGDSLFESSQGDTFREMSDHQLSMDMAKHGGIGLADILVRQLSGRTDHDGDQVDAGQQDMAVTSADEMKLSLRRYPGTSLSNTQIPVPTSAAPDNDISNNSAVVNKTAAVTNSAGNVEQDEPLNAHSFSTPRDFVKGVWKYARAAAGMLGVSPEVVVAQAALETGWGKHIMNHVDGSSSNNLFGIKADERWTGAKAYVPTTEFRHGRVVREHAAFRAYGSLEEGFRDYANFLKSGERYQEGLEASADPEQYIRELHKAGYATDPQYSDKVTRIMKSVEFRKIVAEVGRPL